MKAKHLIKYVESNTPKVKIFTDVMKLSKFEKRFLKKHESNTLDNWIDFKVLGISGKVEFYEKGLLVK